MTLPSRREVSYKYMQLATNEQLFQKKDFALNLTLIGMAKFS